jgi:hypothetical protein
VGWGAEGATRAFGDTLVHGPELELAAFPWGASLAPGRFGFFTQQSLLLSSHAAGVGYGGAVGATVELFGYTSGAFENYDGDGAVAGHSQGLFSIGLYVAGAYRHLGEGDYATATIGVIARTPVAAGVVCCAVPSSDEPSSEDSEDEGAQDDDDGDEGDEPTPKRPREHRPADARPRREHQPAKARVKSDTTRATKAPTRDLKPIRP